MLFKITYWLPFCAQNSCCLPVLFHYWPFHRFFHRMIDQRCVLFWHAIRVLRYCLTKAVWDCILLESIGCIPIMCGGGVHLAGMWLTKFVYSSPPPPMYIIAQKLVCSSYICCIRWFFLKKIEFKVNIKNIKNTIISKYLQHSHSIMRSFKPRE